MAQGDHRKVGLVIAGNLLELTRVQDLVDRDFAAQAADELWIADITDPDDGPGSLLIEVDPSGPMPSALLSLTPASS